MLHYGTAGIKWWKRKGEKNREMREIQEAIQFQELKCSDTGDAVVEESKREM